LSAASKVLLGAVPLPGVVAEKSAVQPEDEVPEVQVFNRLAIELILAAGDEPFEGKEAPGDVPVVRLARLATVATALLRPLVLVADDPMLPPGLRNWASPYAVAAVVTSLMTNCEPDADWLHAPMGAASVMAVFVGPNATRPPWTVT
jgi:hypothetical protein